MSTMEASGCGADATIGENLTVKLLADGEESMNLTDDQSMNLGKKGRKSKAKDESFVTNSNRGRRKSAFVKLMQKNKRKKRKKTSSDEDDPEDDDSDDFELSSSAISKAKRRTNCSELGCVTRRNKSNMYWR